MKWAGGKTQLLRAFGEFYPAACQRYFEPFVGSGAVFFHVSKHLRPGKVWLYDRNAELILAYQTIATNVEGVIRALHRHRAEHSHDHYYQVRAQDPARLSPIARTARLIYLNKTCYNGLYRVNSRNQFNVPMGSYKSPSIFDEETLRATSAVLRSVKFKVADFRKATTRAQSGDFVYFDPPYDPVSRTSQFTSYTDARFRDEDQSALADSYRDLSSRGCRVMLSNSDTPFIRKLYAGFDTRVVPARRTINTRSDRRGPVHELVILNYKPGT